MKTGRAPVGYDGKPVNLHHVSQTQGGSIAEMSQTFHNKYYSKIHSNTGQLPSQIDRKQFDAWRKEYWKNREIELLESIAEARK